MRGKLLSVPRLCFGLVSRALGVNPLFRLIPPNFVAIPTSGIRIEPSYALVFRTPQMNIYPVRGMESPLSIWVVLYSWIGAAMPVGAALFALV